MDGHSFNPPPGWPRPPTGWSPPPGWKPDPNWPDPPDGWVLWLPEQPSDDEIRESSDPQPGERPAVLAPPTPTPLPPPPPALSSNAGPTPSGIPPPAEPPPPAAHADGSAGATDEVRRLQAEVQRLTAALDGLQGGDVVDLSDERVLQEVGIYRYHHPLENAQAYRDRLADIDGRIKTTVVSGSAILANDMFTYNNSLARGRKMLGDLSKLMLRAYNAEADNCIRSLRAGNVITAKKRLENAMASIAKLGTMMEMRVNPDYHSLRVEEIELTGDYLMKVQEEREAAREERERLREERRVEQELAAEREKLAKERSHYLNALEALRANGDDASVADIEARLAQLDEAIATNDYRAANIRAGYVYVISNPGAFGPHMVKIGMTRRLEPMDRVRELGDASVPFPFEVHALFFSEDAVTLETELHHAFATQKVNWVNERREFFFATPSEVGAVLAEKVGNLLEYTEEPEAMQYLQSRGYWPDR